MAAKRTAKELTVLSSTHLTKNMLRLTLHGADLEKFPDNAEGAYFKFNFTSADSSKTLRRTYTISRLRRDKHEMDVDFMLHGNTASDVHGIAVDWAEQAKVGDAISISGPGPATYINQDADWFLLVGDMTALPALTANLALLPENATGYVVVEILSEEDKQPLEIPSSMQLRWVINPHAGSDDTPLVDAVEKLQWLDGQAAIWTACEFKSIKKLRQHYRQLEQVQRTHLYISSYWKKGLTSEQHKVAKRQDTSPTDLLRRLGNRLFNRRRA